MIISNNKNKTLKFEGKIKSLNYFATFEPENIRRYELDSFDINSSASIGLIKIGDSNSMAYSKWVSPKRTRSYPLARIYNTYHSLGKIVTIIPIIKDEGSGGDNDRINFITLSWLNLMNIYIILAWYDSAEKKSEKKITNQKFNKDYINKKLEEIKNFKLDAHHWNNKHFEEEFVDIFNKAINSYKKISNLLSIKLHPEKNNEQFLKSIIKKGKFSLASFREETLTRSQMAAVRESKTNHKLENLSRGSVKSIFKIKNNLGGIYYLTADEVIFKNEKEIIIQESKHSTKNKLPSEDDIKDGLFKLILLSNIDILKLDNKRIKFKPQLRITGKLKGGIKLPSSELYMEKFSVKNNFNQKERKTIISLNKEASKNKFSILISS